MSFEKINVELSASEIDALESAGLIHGGDITALVRDRNIKPNFLSRRWKGVAVAVVVLGVGLFMGSTLTQGPPTTPSKTLSSQNGDQNATGEGAVQADSHDVAQMLFSRTQLNSQHSESGRTPFFNVMLYGTWNDIAAAAKQGGKPNIPQWQYDGPPNQGQWVEGKKGNNILQVLIKMKKRE